MAVLDEKAIHSEIEDRFPSDLKTDKCLSDATDLESVKHDDAPNGGFKAWLCLAGAFCSCLTCSGWALAGHNTYLLSYSNSNGKKIPQDMKELLWWYLMVAAPFAAFMFASDWITKRHGPQIALQPGILALSLRLIVLSPTHPLFKYWYIITSTLGATFTGTATLAALGTWFDRRQRLPYGLIAFGYWVSFSGEDLFADAMIQRFGLVDGVYYIGCLTVVLLVFAGIAITTRIPPGKNYMRVKDIPFASHAIGWGTLIVLGLSAATWSFVSFYLQESRNSSVVEAHCCCPSQT